MTVLNMTITMTQIRVLLPLKTAAYLKDKEKIFYAKF